VRPSPQPPAGHKRPNPRTDKQEKQCKEARAGSGSANDARGKADAKAKSAWEKYSAAVKHLQERQTAIAFAQRQLNSWLEGIQRQENDVRQADAKAEAARKIYADTPIKNADTLWEKVEDADREAEVAKERLTKSEDGLPMYENEMKKAENNLSQAKTEEEKTYRDALKAQTAMYDAYAKAKKMREDADKACKFGFSKTGGKIGWHGEDREQRRTKRQYETQGGGQVTAG
jgi:chromosome segregation ATPase